MVVSPLAEATTASFYAWELRGRGWTVAPYLVMLEPPYRNCFLLPDVAPAFQSFDDGKRPTLLSSLVDGVRDAFRAPVSVPAAITPFEEPAPHPVEPSDDATTLRVLTPGDWPSDMEAMRRFLAGLSALQAPLSFELIGSGDKVHVQVAADASEAPRIAEALSGYLPGAVVAEAPDALTAAWDVGKESFFVDFGLSDEFFLPLNSFKSFSLDPYITLVAALARARPGETLAFQVLFAPVVNRWDRATMAALVSHGEPVFEDAPEFVPLAKEKIAAPLFAVVVRLAACAATKERARELVRGTADFFTQFARPGANSFIPLTNEGYPDEEHETAFLCRATQRTGMLLSAGELLGLVHLPDASVRHTALARLEKRTKALPEEARGHELALGINEHHGARETASLALATRFRHMHVLGASGTGKSTLLLNLIRQDIASGKGVAVLDPHGDLIDAVLAFVPPARHGDVVLFDPSDEVAPVGINLLQAATPVEKTLLSSDLVSVFRRFATSWGDGMSTVLGNAVLALLESKEPTTLLDLRRFLVEESFRKQFLRDIPDPEVQFFWRSEFPLIGARALGPILTRLNAFLRPRLVRNVVAQRKPRVSLEAVVGTKKIFLAKLAQGLIGSENAHLLGSLIATKFHQVALSRQALAASERLPFFLYIDEFQHFMTPSIDSLLAEARKYSIGLVLAHQTLHQLREVPTVEAAVLGNAHTRVTFRVGDEDARKLAEGLSYFESKDLSNLKQGEAIVRLGLSGNDFNLRVLLPQACQTENAAPSIQRLSREQFGMAAEALAAELAASYGQEDPSKTRDTPSTPQPERPAARQEVPNVEVSIVPQDTFVPLTMRRRSETKEPRTEGRGGKEHKYLQHLVKRLAEERGFRATIEQTILDGKGQVDVALTRNDLRIAVEISVSTGAEWEERGVRQCLAAGFHHVVLLTKNERTAQTFRKRIVEQLEESDRSRVHVLLAQDVVAYLDQFEAQPEESVVRGYKVKVKRQNIAPEDASRRRSEIANVVARSIDKNKGR